MNHVTDLLILSAHALYFPIKYENYFTFPRQENGYNHIFLRNLKTIFTIVDITLWSLTEFDLQGHEQQYF